MPSQILVALKDPKSWVYALIQACIATGVGTVGVFLPTFVKAFGYSACKAWHIYYRFLELTPLTVQTQLFTVIPYACAFFTSYRRVHNLRHCQQERCPPGPLSLTLGYRLHHPTHQCLGQGQDICYLSHYIRNLSFCHIDQYLGRCEYRRVH